MSFSYSLDAKVAMTYIITLRGDEGKEKDVFKLIKSNDFSNYIEKSKPGFLQIGKYNDSKNYVLNFQQLENTKTLEINIIASFSDSNYKYLFIVVPDRKDASKRKICIFGLMSSNDIECIKKKIPKFGLANDMRSNNYSIAEDMFNILKLININFLSNNGQLVNLMKETIKTPLQKIFHRRFTANISGQTELPRLRSKRYKQFNSGLGMIPQKRGTNRTLDKCKSKSIEHLISNDCDEVDNAMMQTSNNVLGLSIKPPLMGLKRMGVNNNHEKIYQSTGNNVSNKMMTSSMIRVASQSSLNDLKYKDQNYSIQSSNDAPQIYSFDIFLQDPIAIQCFYDFLKSEYSAENISFWMAINKYTEIEDLVKMKEEANKIYMTYIHSTSETPVNLEGHTVAKIKEKLDNPDSNMFDEARSHVYKLMKTDSYTRFLRSNSFEKWKEMTAKEQGNKSASASSLNNSRRRKSYLPAFWKGSRGKLSKDGSRKSSIQTLGSDLSMQTEPQNCKLILVFEDNIEYSVSYDKQNKRLGSLLKKLSKQFNEYEFTAYDDCDNKIISFYEVMLNLFGHTICIEPSCIIRIGLVQDNMETIIYEDQWFLMRPRHHHCLSTCVNFIVKRFSIKLDKYVVIDEDTPSQIIAWSSPIVNFNRSKLLLIEKDLFKKVKFYGKPLPDVLNELWKSVIKDTSFLNMLNFDDDNVIESKIAFPKKKLEPRRIGYRVSKSVSESLPETGDDKYTSKTEHSTAKQSMRSTDNNGDYDLDMPEFLLAAPKQPIKSTTTTNTNTTTTTDDDCDDLLCSEDYDLESGSDEVMLDYGRNKLMQRRLDYHRLLVDMEDGFSLSDEDLDVSGPSPSTFELISDVD